MRQHCNTTCDNCKSLANGFGIITKDRTSHALQILSILKEANKLRDSITIVQTANVYLGLSSKTTAKYSHLLEYGAGKKEFNKSEIERLIHHLIFRQMIREEVRVT